MPSRTEVAPFDSADFEQFVFAVVDALTFDSFENVDLMLERFVVAVTIAFAELFVASVALSPGAAFVPMLDYVHWKYNLMLQSAFAQGVGAASEPGKLIRQWNYAHLKM